MFVLKHKVFIANSKVK